MYFDLNIPCRLFFSWAYSHATFSSEWVALSKFNCSFSWFELFAYRRVWRLHNPLYPTPFVHHHIRLHHNEVLAACWFIPRLIIKSTYTWDAFYLSPTLHEYVRLKSPRRLPPTLASCNRFHLDQTSRTRSRRTYNGYSGSLEFDEVSLTY